MSNDIFQRISIPKPCHEDWNKMTPDAKGAFCKVCSKSVHDFSQKSAEEVERILMAEIPGKVCGRFSSEQLGMPKDLVIPSYLLPRNISPFRAFALAVFLVFGTALFGLTDAFGQKMVGKVCYHPSRPDTAAQTESPRSTKGDVAYVPPVQEIPVEKLQVLGGVCMRPPIAEHKQPVVTQNADSIPLVETIPETKGQVVVQGEGKTVLKDRVILVDHESVSLLMTSGDVVVTRSEYNEPEINGLTVVTPPVADSTHNPLSDGPPLLLNPEEVTKNTTPIDYPEFVWGDTSISRIVSSAQPLEYPVTERFTAGMMVIAPVVTPQPPADVDSSAVAMVPETPSSTTTPETTVATTLQETPADSSDAKIKETADSARLQPLNDGPPTVSCYPNPSNGPVTLSYELKQRADVEAMIYDLQGNLIQSVFQVKDHFTGIYRQQLDLSGLNNATYLVRLRIGETVTSLRLVLQK